MRLSDLVGLRIAEARAMTKEEVEQEGWECGPEKQPIVLVLNNGLKLYPGADNEGSAPGALFGFIDGMGLLFSLDPGVGESNLGVELDTVLRALRGLGGTPEQVAHRLEELGHTDGIPNVARGDPIYLFLMSLPKSLGVPKQTLVGPVGIRIPVGGGEVGIHFQRDGLYAVQDFIRRYDLGEFPSLISPSHLEFLKREPGKEGNEKVVYVLDRKSAFGQE